MLPQFLTENYPVEKHLFLIPRFALRAIGFYPESKWTRWLQFWAFFNIAILGYGCYAEFSYGVYYLKIDIPTALDALCPVATSIMSFIKMYFIWWYRDDYRKLIEVIRCLTKAQTSISKERVKRKYFTLATRLNAFVLFLGFFTSTSYTIRQILTNTMLYLNGKSIIYETPFKMIFPEPLLSMPCYPLTYLFVHWYGYITALSFVGVDGFYLGFCLYFATLLKELQEDLDGILADIDGKKDFTNDAEKEVCLALTSIIDRHNEIASWTEKLSSIMVEITLSHFITSSVIIATSVVDLLLFSGYGAVVYVAHTCAVTSEIFLYCLGGTAVMESSEEIATRAYCSQWYKHGVKIQKMILLIILRSQRAIVVKIPFFNPSLPTLTAILKFTGSVVALVKSMI